MADESAGQFDVALPSGDVAMAARSAAFLQVYQVHVGIIRLRTCCPILCIGWYRYNNPMIDIEFV